MENNIDQLNLKDSIKRLSNNTSRPNRRCRMDRRKSTANFVFSRLSSSKDIKQ